MAKRSISAKIRVGLLFGGESPEHDVSIRSAATVLTLLDPKRFQIVPIGITRDGKWRVPKTAKTNGAADAQKFLTSIVKTGKPFPDWENLAKKVDVVFPALHGPLGEDGTIQGLCELAHVPCAGCGVLASALGMDKSMQKRVFNHQKLPVLESYTFEKWSWKMLADGILQDIRNRFQYPVFVKPCNQGSSVGVSRADDEASLQNALEHAFKYDVKVIVEKGIDGAREFEVAVMGNEIPEVSIVGESIPSNQFFDYEAKYVKPSAKKIPAEIPQSAAEQMRAWAGMAYLALDCKGYARVDFLAKKDMSAIYIGEINTLPGLTQTSAFLKLWEAQGKKPADVLEKIIALALDRRKQAPHPPSPRTA